MLVPEIDQVDGIFVASDDVWQLGEHLREQRLQIGRMRVVSGVFYLLRAALRRPIHYKDARLVPDAD